MMSYVLYDKIWPVQLWKKGLLTIGFGILAVFLAFLPGAGPCGPSTPIGTVIMLLGMLTVPIGALIFLVGLIKARF
jgi:hypothetical protein